MNSRIIIFGLLVFVGLALGSLMALNPEPWCLGDYRIATAPDVATAGSSFTLAGQLYITSQCDYPYYQTKWIVEVIPPEGSEAPARRIADTGGWQDGFGEIIITIGSGPAWVGWTIVANSSCKCVYPWCLFEDDAYGTWVIQAQ